ncbi:MAG: 2-amino-4-hydroxy-6-hydroxymethyldihydropteridine diphosphokinase [Thiomargarita sp.]|nr:2-amino-4-hydroxy-6-hydroxymethyldihydropteridine diphosphokinase [Thiomargarita sp.]
MTDNAIVYVGLGSNLENPISQIKQAFLALDALPKTHIKKQSALYRSKPMGPQNQPDYMNAVVMLSTYLLPLDLLDMMQAIEHQQGRIRTAQRWGARTLDLDMLLYDQQQLQLPRLILPHPGLYVRDFVLYPLYEITPNLVLPNGKKLVSYLR